MPCGCRLVTSSCQIVMVHGFLWLPPSLIPQVFGPYLRDQACQNVLTSISESCSVSHFLEPSSICLLIGFEFLPVPFLLKRIQNCSEPFAGTSDTGHSHGRAEHGLSPDVNQKRGSLAERAGTACQGNKQPQERLQPVPREGLGRSLEMRIRGDVGRMR